MIILNGTWQMNCKGEDFWQEGQVPGTVDAKTVEEDLIVWSNYRIGREQQLKGSG